MFGFNEEIEELEGYNLDPPPPSVNGSSYFGD